jgi:hypothetical protein
MSRDYISLICINRFTFRSSFYLSLMTLIKYSFINFIQHVDQAFDMYFRFLLSTQNLTLS